MHNLYNLFLYLHSWNRWLILLSGLLLLVVLSINLSTRKAFTAGLKTNALIFLGSLHLQLLAGLILYFFLSPLTQAAFNDFGEAMKNATLRYWAVEHTLLNIIGIVLAQTGYSLSKRKPTDRAKQKTLLIWNAIAFVIILLAIPMGLFGADRPWFRI